MDEPQPVTDYLNTFGVTVPKEKWAPAGAHSHGVEFVNVFSVSAMSFSIKGRILSLYFDKSALCKYDSIMEVYCGFAKPTWASDLMHCLAVIGFSSVI